MLGIKAETVLRGARIMVFADCENIVSRTTVDPRAEELGWVSDGKFFSWTPVINRVLSNWGRLIRVWGYTSAHGDDAALNALGQRMKDAGINAPCVFKKVKASKRKQVDIALATEATRQAYLGNFDVAVFVTGDGDFAPVFRCLKDMGKRVVLLSPPSGLSSALERESDEHYPLEPLLQHHYCEVEVLSKRQPLAGQMLDASKSSAVDYSCIVPLLLRRSADAAPGRRSIALAARIGNGGRQILLAGGNIHQTLSERNGPDEEEIKCGAQMIELFPGLEYSELHLRVSLFGTVPMGTKVPVILSIYSEVLSDEFRFEVVASAG